METLEIAFEEGAIQDLQALTTWLSLQGVGQRTIEGYTGRIDRRCRRLGFAPRAGRAHHRLGKGVRSVSFERTATIYYRVEVDRVLILRILRRGRDVPRPFTP